MIDKECLKCRRYLNSCDGVKDRKRKIITIENSCSGFLKIEDTNDIKYDQLNTTIQIATLKALKTDRGTVNVEIQNCPSGVIAILSGFDINNKSGQYKWDINKPKERPKISFECPIEFLDFINSNMGYECFKRMGVEAFYIEQKNKDSIDDYNEKMKNKSDRYSEYMEMKNMYEEGLLEQ